MSAFLDLRSYLEFIKKQNQLVEIEAEVDPYLELAEIHRRVIEEQGKALLFKNVKGSNFPVVSNLFGTKERVDWAFGDAAKDFVKTAASLPEELMPPSLAKLWQKKDFLGKFTKLGTKNISQAPVKEVINTEPDLEKLPIITSWIEDGGPFITLPLVYTEHPKTGVPNLGMYRMQRFSKNTTGMHMQIGKGGGFHLAAAKELNQKLPINVFVGGPPAAIISAIAPLPENVPELMLTSVFLEKKLKLTKDSNTALPFLADAEFVMSGEVDPNEYHPEGPFGDHFGYYSLKHDFPLFRVKTLYHRKNAIFPVTVVGKPRQEDFFIGDYLQELLSPLFPLVMPAVKDLWSYGETGFHSLATAVVRERYKRESMVSGFRILGEGQLSLTKFLILIDKEQDIKDFPKVLEYVLKRADFRTDLFIFSNLSMDTLDYTGPKLNEGSKGILIGMGDPIRELKNEYTGDYPIYLRNIETFCPGCLVVNGQSYKEQPDLAKLIAKENCFKEWPLIVLCDDAEKAASSSSSFLWTTFTRFEPAADVYSRNIELARYHPSLTPPIVIDARMKPSYPDELECDENTKSLVDRRWSEYFGK